MLLFPSTPITSPTPAAIEALVAAQGQPHYLIFFASPTAVGLSWCGDCTRSVELLSKYIPKSQSTLIHVGDRATWRDPQNPWKHSPYNIEKLPTVVKVSPGQSIKFGERLVEGDVSVEAKLQKFSA